MQEALTLRKHSKQNPNKLVNNGNHSLFVTPKLGMLFPKVLPKNRTPLNNVYSHLIEDVSQMRITLFRNTFLKFHGSRLLNDWVSARILNKLLPRFKPADVSDLSNKPCSKERRDSRDRRNDINLVQKKLPNLRLKSGRDFFEMRKEEKELVNVELKGDLKSVVRDTDGVRSEVNDILGGKRRVSTFSLDETVSYSLFTCPCDKRSRRVRTKNREEGVGEDIEVVFSFWEKDGEGELDLSFALGYFVFDFLNLSCKELNGRGVNGRVCNEERVGSGEDSDKEGIPFVGFGRVGGRKELDKVVNSFRVDDFNVKALFREEDKERDVEPAGRFHNDSRGVEGREDLSEGREAICGIVERAFFDNLHGVGINDTEVEGVFGDVNAYVEHDISSEEVFFKLSLISILPNGWGLKAQSTNWELRDRGTDSFRGFEAYEKWSPCPSLLQ